MHINGIPDGPKNPELPFNSVFNQYQRFQRFPGFPGFPRGPGFQAPSGPPPRTAPSRASMTPLAVDPGSIRFCLFRFTYIWPRRGQPFWLFPVTLGRRSIAGFRWTGFRWVFFGMDLDQIDAFQCV
ncbi:MAG TPA: hypothetical protein PLD49_05210 [Thermoclostridium caenicola]|uniref:hypothetical protein n=1 Tax=Thermoclostridium caenicola TaxID=659425 RepID=UPI001FAAD27E|nr:hypothetical protein [Thermoclostridium caenicola]HOK43043.1 hypothetical protein [Thermoclostridium caenicola]HOL84860.1 hypothetical protein [Thermoclostridium caenicola]HOP72037.1 hypothetical protein [Thermoclostridium caenicola]HPO76998.1 hypothetical protein [Thermoclostridium caenicola]